MAEGQTGGTWWGGWLESAKAKSASAVEFLKKDLQEFTNVMKDDTTKVADDVKKQLTQENATAATQKVKDGMSKVIGGITKALVIEPENRDKSRSGKKPSGEPIFDRAKARLRAVQLDPSTYCDEPDGDPDDYKKWLENFVLDSKKGDISELLVVNVDVRSLYTQLVPSEVSHADFWHRYFYKLHQLDQDEQRKAALMKRADVAQEQLDLEWEDDDWDDIEGPASPPKPAAGSLNIAMATKETSRTDDDQDDERKEEREKLKEDVRVPENGTPVPDEVPKELASKEHGQTHVDPETTKHSSAQVVEDTTIGNSPCDTDTPETDTIDKCDISSSDSIETDTIQEQTNNAQESSAPNLSSATAAAPSVMEPLVVDTDIKTRDKGDMVVVGSEGTTPSSDSTATTKESTSLDDDWEKDFDDDIEVTEEDMKLAAEAAKKLADSGAIEDDGDDDWESWD